MAGLGSAAKDTGLGVAGSLFGSCSFQVEGLAQELRTSAAGAWRGRAAEDEEGRRGDLTMLNHQGDQFPSSLRYGRCSPAFLLVAR